TWVTDAVEGRPDRLNSSTPRSVATPLVLGTRLVSMVALVVSTESKTPSELVSLAKPSGPATWVETLGRVRSSKGSSKGRQRRGRRGSAGLGRGERSRERRRRARSMIGPFRKRRTSAVIL